MSSLSDTKKTGFVERVTGNDRRQGVDPAGRKILPNTSSETFYKDDMLPFLSNIL